MRHNQFRHHRSAHFHVSTLISPVVRHSGPPYRHFPPRMCTPTGQLGRDVHRAFASPLTSLRLVDTYMASSSTSAASAELPELPPKLRRKPQRKGNVGEGKLYADEAAFKADADKWDQEWRVRDEQVKERERVRQQIRERGRDRSDRKRDPNDNARRVKQKQAANPNVLSPDVVNAFNDIVQGEAYKWCEGHNISPAIVADGLQPPKCLIDFLDSGGSADAHPPGDDRTLLQIAADSCQVPLPRVVELLLQRGAGLRGSLQYPSPLDMAVRYWHPRCKPCPEMHCNDQDLDGEGCFCFAKSTAGEKAIRLLIAAGARDSHALQEISVLTLEIAAEEVCERSRHINWRPPDHGLRHAWSQAKLKEIQQLFLQSHPLTYRRQAGLF